MDATSYNKIILEYFRDKNIEYETDFKSNEIDSGKSILFKDKVGFRLFTIRANLEIDNKKVRKILSSQKLRFATPDELLHITGVIPGALPPLARPLIDLDHYLDQSILDHPNIAFNAAIIGKRIRLKTSDYLSIVSPTICEFKKV